MKKIFAALLTAALFSLAGCGRLFLPIEPASVPAETVSAPSSPSSAPEEASNPLQQQAEQLAGCFVCYALTPALRQEMMTVTDWHTLMKKPVSVYTVTDFLLAAWRYPEESEFPYAGLASVSADGKTVYISDSAAQQAMEQLFNFSDWASTPLESYYCDETGQTEMPMELCRYENYGYEEMESVTNPDGSISVFLQLIDDPSFPGVDWYGKYRFDFQVCGEEEDTFLRLSACGREEPADPEKRAALNLKEPPLSYSAKTSPPPDFLDEEQQYLYLRAKTIYSTIRKSTTSIDDRFPPKEQSGPVQYEIVQDENGFSYHISTGRYRRWADFEAMMRSIFTEEYFYTLIEVGGECPIIFEKDGLLCYQEADAGGRWRYQTPDEYNLLEKTETSITFEVIGHYESREYEDVIETEAFPIRMVRTEEGWRFSEFAYAG